jgi:hypothetical protein
MREAGQTNTIFLPRGFISLPSALDRLVEVQQPGLLSQLQDVRQRLYRLNQLELKSPQARAALYARVLQSGLPPPPPLGPSEQKRGEMYARKIGALEPALLEYIESGRREIAASETLLHVYTAADLLWRALCEGDLHAQLLPDEVAIDPHWWRSEAGQRQLLVHGVLDLAKNAPIHVIREADFARWLTALLHPTKPPDELVERAAPQAPETTPESRTTGAPEAAEPEAPPPAVDEPVEQVVEDRPASIPVAARPKAKPPAPGDTSASQSTNASDAAEVDERLVRFVGTYPERDRRQQSYNDWVSLREQAAKADPALDGIKITQKRLRQAIKASRR